MIAPHRPSFGIVRALASFLPIGHTTIRDLEQCYARWSGCAAVWLPSARAGIFWALQAALQAGGKVISPAFTCSAVHQTLASWPGEVHLVDAADTGFLMALDRLRAAQTGPHALVLCEAFGHVYDLDQLNALNE